MASKRPPRPQAELQPRLRVIWGSDIALGPGKVDLLRHLQETHSITDAAARMHMSYMRAWTLIRTMNACFQAPLVTTRRGGARRGGADLTPTGRTVLVLYERLEAQTHAATARTRRRLLSLLKTC